MIRFKSLSLNMTLYIVSLALITGCVKAQKQDGSSTNGIAKAWTMSLGGRQVDVNGYNGNIYSSSRIMIEAAEDVSVIDKINARYPNKRKYSFVMQITDRRTNQPVQGAKFNLYSELTQGLPIPVEVKWNNANNEIRWDMEVDYDFFADPVNLKVNFVFKSVNKPLAYIHRVVKLNPWDKKRGTNQELVDITNKTLTDAQREQTWANGAMEISKALDGKLVKSVKRLIVGSFSRQIVRKRISSHRNNLGAEAQRNRKEILAIRKGKDESKPYYEAFDADLQITMKDIKICLYDSSGGCTPQPLDSGRYRVEAQMLATDIQNGGQNYIISDNLPMKRDWSSSVYGLRANLPLSVLMKPNWGNLSLAVRVVPSAVDFPGVSAFEAVYHLGRFDEMAQRGSVEFDLSEYHIDKVTREFKFDYQDYLEEADNYAAWESGHARKLRKQSFAIEKEFRAFEFGTFDILFGRVMPGDTATDRTIQYTVQSCLKDQVTGRSLGKGMRFKITTEDRGEKLDMIAETRRDGCLNWYGLISHKYYHREDLVKKISKIEYLGEKNSKPYEFAYYINPWDEKFTFGRDGRVLSPEYLADIKEQQKFAPPTRLLVTAFHYTTISFRYAVDNFMNLTVKKSVLLETEPKILKYNSIIFGRSGLQPMRDGVYLMKIALQKHYLDPAPRTVHHSLGRDENSNTNYVIQDEKHLDKREYLMVKEKLVRVLGGKIITPVQFEIKDLRLMRIRNHFLIQLETIDEGLLRKIDFISGRLLVKGRDSINKTKQVIKLLSDENKAEENLSKIRQYSDVVTTKFYSEMLKELTGHEAQLKKILSSLNKENMDKTLKTLDTYRQLGQSASASALNAKYNVLNEILSGLKGKLQSETGLNGRQAKVAKSNYVQAQRVDCETSKQALLDRGLKDEARKFEPGRIGCPIKIPKDQLFYHLTSSGDMGSDAWLSRLLSEKEYNTYKSGRLTEDFTTKVYKPDYNFDLLSNEGDERDIELMKQMGVKMDGGPRSDGYPEVNPYVSGLSRRTFVGPITVLPSDNGSAVRPTDVLSESQCGFDFTCSQLKELSKVGSRDMNKDVVKNIQQLKLSVKDFNQPINGNYESSPYFGSVGHFYNKSVNDLIPRKVQLDLKAELENEYGSRISNFLSLYKLNYVSFASSSRKRLKGLTEVSYECFSEKLRAIYKMGENLSYSIKNLDLNQFSLKDCYKGMGITDRYVKQKHFLTDFSDFGREDERYGNKAVEYSVNKRRRSLVHLSLGETKEFSKNGLSSRKLSFEQKLSFMHRMCFVLRRQLVSSKRFKKKSWYQAETEEHRLLTKIEKRCQEGVDAYFTQVKESFDNDLSNKESSEKMTAAFRRHAPMSPLVVERRVRVHKTSGKYKYKDGKSLNYNVGANFGVSHSTGIERGVGADPKDLVTGIAGLFGKAGEKVANAIKGFTGGFTYKWGWNDGSSRSDGTSISVGTYLAAQLSTLDIELKEWEKCSVIRYDSKLHLQAMEMFASNKKLNYDRKKDVSGIGYMMCSGDIDTVDDMPPLKDEGKDLPLRIRERYVYFTQHFTEGDMQDPGSLVNHPWMLQLRGLRDYADFVRIMKGKRQEDLGMKDLRNLIMHDMAYLFSYMSESKKFDAESALKEIPRDTLAKPINMMAETYRQVMPTFPGMYTFVDSLEEQVTNWPSEESQTPNDSFENEK